MPLGQCLEAAGFERYEAPVTLVGIVGELVVLVVGDGCLNLGAGIWRPGRIRAVVGEQRLDAAVVIECTVGSNVRSRTLEDVVEYFDILSLPAAIIVVWRIVDISGITAAVGDDRSVDQGALTGAGVGRRAAVAVSIFPERYTTPVVNETIAGDVEAGVISRSYPAIGT